MIRTDQPTRRVIHPNPFNNQRNKLQQLNRQRWNHDGTVPFQKVMALKHSMRGADCSEKSRCGRRMLSNKLMKSSSAGNQFIKPYNQITRKIYLGDGHTAQDISTLKRLGITHVLNAAHGYQFGQVFTGAQYYSSANIRFLGIPALDNNTFDISQYFELAAQFIDTSIRSGGCVYVHCRAGISRSAALVIAYLMLKKDMSVENALDMVKSKRAIAPNDGFLMQLCRLEREIRNG